MFGTTSKIVSVEFPWDCDLPMLTDMSNSFNSGKLRKIHFPQNLPEVTTLSQAINRNIELYDLRLWEYSPKLTDLGHFIYDARITGEIVMPNLPALINLLYGFIGLNYLKKITFTGPSPNFAGVQSMFDRCFMLEEVVLPTEWCATMYSPWGSLYNFLKKLKVPDKLLMSGNNTSSPAFYFGPSIEEITGEADSSELTSQGTLSISTVAYNTIRIVNVPKYGVQSISAGTSSTSKRLVLETLEWDVENSEFASATAPQIKIAAPFDANWLNTLFNRLPVLSGKKLDVQGCDGWDDCDPLIAEAKGWVCYGLARLTGTPVTDIGNKTATSGGNVYFSGQYAISQMGVCYSYTGIPTTSNTKSYAPVALGEFTCNIIGLIANKTYYLRAYCMTQAGTAYGEVFTFTTLP